MYTMETETLDKQNNANSEIILNKIVYIDPEFTASYKLWRTMLYFKNS